MDLTEDALEQAIVDIKRLQLAQSERLCLDAHFLFYRPADVSEKTLAILLGANLRSDDGQ